MSKSVKKLGTDQSYKRPKVTFQEKLSADEIAEKLQGYEQVADIAEVPLQTHLRYFIKDENGNQVFRLGGFLYNKTNAEKFVMLSNGKNVWSVQVKNTVFFKKMSQKEEIDSLHKQYQKKIAEKDQIIDKLKKYIKENLPANKSTKIIASVQPTKQVQLAKSVQPTKSKSAKSATSAKSAKSTKSAKSATSAKSTKSTKSAKSAKSTKPIKSTKSGSKTTVKKRTAKKRT